MSVRFAGYDPADLSVRASALGCLMATCALALEAVGNWRDDIRKNAEEDIRNTLILGAYEANAICADIADRDEKGRENDAR